MSLLPERRSLERKLGYKFNDPALLLQALTHSSYAHEQPAGVTGNNERLEFLGDAVLELLTAEMLYRRKPAVGEGQMTLERAAMVSTGALAEAARALGLGAHLRVGRGVEKSGGRDLPSLLGNAVEAVLGAVYLDGGLEPARKVFKKLSAGAGGRAVNHKGALQERTQSSGRGVPEYVVLDATGPGHARVYRVGVRLGEAELAVGEGATRRAAEQAAAAVAIRALEAAAKAVARPRKGSMPAS